MDLYSNSDQQAEKVDDEEYKEREYPTRQKAEREPEERGYKRWILGRKKKRVRRGSGSIFAIQLQIVKKENESENDPVKTSL